MNDTYDQYEKLVRQEAEKRHLIPHCDSNVLHSPKSCDYCDDWPELQEFRLKHRMNFTNEEFNPQRHKWLCPSLIKRDLETIERWGGNIANVSVPTNKNV